jgi:hypothetical protein
MVECVFALGLYLYTREGPATQERDAREALRFVARVPLLTASHPTLPLRGAIKRR